MITPKQHLMMHQGRRRRHRLEGRNADQQWVRRAFTLVELLIAMTVTLLLMAALAKVFGSIGRSIQDGRARINLSSKLRGASFRLRADLRNRTVDAQPPISVTSGQGYLMYYEGPLTDSTYGGYGAEPVRTRPNGQAIGLGTTVDTDGDMVTDFYDPDIEKSPTYRRHSRFGDFDDVLAFTAEASGDNWFTGTVPRYLVDDTYDTNANGIIDVGEQAAAMEPTVIRSKFAEIIVWAAPRWQIDPTNREVALAPHPSGMPLFRDADIDLIPDEVVLHQRTLLIRPDLNQRMRVPSTTPILAFEDDVLRPALGDPNDLENVPLAMMRAYPIGQRNDNAPPNAGPVIYDPIYPAYVHPNTAGTNANHQFFMQSNWLVGMAPMHHFFDLSLRRVVNPRTGEPTPYVACNSLSDLTVPHNRFGMVRYPGRFFGRGDFSSINPSADNATSMPMLATGWNDVLTNWLGDADPRWETSVSQTTPPSPGAVANWFPGGKFESRTRNLNETGGDVFTGLFQGWLLPQFELGNANPSPADDTSGTGVEPDNQGWYRRYLPTYDARWDRSGEDIVMGGILSFDLKGFDRTSPIFATSGADGAPGRVGINDDGLGTNPDETFVPTAGVAYSELGYEGSDDTIITPSDVGVFELLGNNLFDPTDPSTFGTAFANQGLTSRGGFVDLAYPYLAGSPLLAATNYATGLAPPPAAYTAAPNRYFNFFNSELSMHTGRTTVATSGIRPALDDSLKRSGKLLHAGGVVVYMQPAYDTWTDYYESDGFDQTQTLAANNPNPPTVPNVGTVWVLKSPQTDNISTPFNESILDENRIVATGNYGSLQIDTGLKLPGESETSPPFPVDMPAMSATVRVFDRDTGEIEEYTIVEDL